MAYNELIKNFDRIREYMRDFYIYGFRSREEFDRKSARSYDDERRRIESWLKDYMGFRHTADGKNVFISIDSRESVHNPLFTAWKARSFTDGDITLHFIIFDILCTPDIKLSFQQITEIIDRDYLSEFADHRVFDESTIRKKLKKYTDAGLLETEKQGKNVLYRRTSETNTADCDALDFFSETLPCGVIGSYILDSYDEHGSHFAFKHHYITQSLDSDILCSLFDAMSKKCSVTIENCGRSSDESVSIDVIPLRIFVSVRTGRQYLLAYNCTRERFSPFRTDYIKSVNIGKKADNFDELRSRLNDIQNHMWGVNTGPADGSVTHVEFTVSFQPHETYIVERLEREKRCGTLEMLDESHCRFSADVYDVGEMIPWIRTFICRITDLNISDSELQQRFTDDLDAMYRMYGIEEEVEK